MAAPAKLSGHVTLRAAGSSIAATLASGDGQLDLFVPEGRVSTLALVLADLDLGKAAELVVFGDRAARVNCMVASASLRNGVLVADHLILDSSEANITGEGSISFATRRYDPAAEGKIEARQHRAVACANRDRRHLQAPRSALQTGPVAGRVAAAVALGALLTPFAALVPLIDVGNAEG